MVSGSEGDLKVSPEDKNSGMAKHMSECQDVCDLLRSSEFFVPGKWKW